VVTQTGPGGGRLPEEKRQEIIESLDDIALTLLITGAIAVNPGIVIAIAKFAARPLIAAGLAGAALNAGEQLGETEGDWSKLDVAEIAGSAAYGAGIIGMAFLTRGKSLIGNLSGVANTAIGDGINGQRSGSFDYLSNAFWGGVTDQLTSRWNDMTGFSAQNSSLAGKIMAGVSYSAIGGLGYLAQASVDSAITGESRLGNNMMLNMIGSGLVNLSGLAPNQLAQFGLGLLLNRIYQASNEWSDKNYTPYERN
jgi:hypothetical protein